MPVGKRIYLKRNMPDPEIMKEFANIPASNVADCMERICAMNPRIRLISKPKKEITAAPAYTVKVRGGDNLALHAALTYCNEGDMIVVSNEEDSNRALIGEVMMTFLRYEKKAAGIIIDGPIRDIGELSQWDFPIYCTGSTPAGPFKNGPGEINVPIACGGIQVNPGDIILADADGVIAIPRNDAAEILPRAKEYMEKDSAKVVAAKEGRANRAWVLRELEEKNFEIIDDIYRG